MRKLNHIGRMRVRAHDADGNLIADVEGPMHSYTKNYLYAWYRRITEETVTGLTEANDTTYESTRSYWNTTTGYQRGIVVGSGSTASTFGDTKLESLIDHGTGSGELEHGDDTITINESDGEIDSETERTFTNSSGGDVTVREVGIHGSTSSNSTFETNLHLVLREVLDEDIVIPDSGTITVTIYRNINTAASSSVMRALALQEANRYGTISYNGETTVNSGTLSTSYITTQLASDPDDPRGIVVGTSATPLDKDNDDQPSLVSIIDGGSSAGELNWTTTTVDLPVIGADGGSFTVRKTFVNNSGGDITIAEVGLYGFTDNDDDDDDDTIMLLRTVLSETITLADGEGVELTYTFSVNHDGEY